MHKKKEEQLFEQWTELYRRSIRAYLFSLSRDASLAEDLSQETFLRAWRFRANYEPSGSAKAYLFRIASRVWMDHLRKRREKTLDEQAWISMECPAGDSSPHENAERQDDLARMRRAMSSLSSGQNQVLSLRYFAQMKYVEIAEVLELPLGTVVSLVQRGLDELKKRMNQEEKR